MSEIRPFRAWRPAPDLVEKVASPPYDVINSQEAREMAAGNEVTFLHVVKPEIDLDPSVELYSDPVYAMGAANLQRFMDDGVLIQEEQPAYYIYQQIMDGHKQAGVVAGASVVEYENDLIKKHEFTRPDKENDRTRHVRELNANTGPVFLTYHARQEIDALVDQVRTGTPTYDFTAPDGIQHTAWAVTDEAMVARFTEAFAAVPASYVADGHHRSASAARVGKERRDLNPNHTGDEVYNHFLAVFFPHDQLLIMDYNRVVKDLAGMSHDEFLAAVAEKFDVTDAPADNPKPTRPTTFGMFLGDKWYRLAAKAGTYPTDDPVKSLDVAILQDNLISPVLGIDDPRRDTRIDFVGGIRGMKELERRVHEGCAVAFAFFPTNIVQLMSVADAGQVMPPKSTWFEPKLRSGLMVRSLKED